MQDIDDMPLPHPALSTQDAEALADLAWQAHAIMSDTAAARLRARIRTCLSTGVIDATTRATLDVYLAT